MGNVLEHAAATANANDREIVEQDLKWMAVKGSVIFNDDHVEEEYATLPEFPGTEIEKAGSKGDKEGAKEDVPGAVRRMLQLMGPPSAQPVTTIEDFPALCSDTPLHDSSYGTLLKMRSRLLQRIHLAVLRQQGRVASATGAIRESYAQEWDSSEDSQEKDPGAILTAGSFRMCLTLMKALRTTAPELFYDMSQSLMDLFSTSAPFALANVKSAAYRDTLDSIMTFAVNVSVAAEGAERAQAMALMLALGVARGSVDDIISVVSRLLHGRDTLPQSSDPFKKRMKEHKTPLLLKHPSPESVVSTFAAKLDGEGQECVTAVSNLATDGVYLYVWEGATMTLNKIGTGFHGTIAGHVYVKKWHLLDEIKRAKGLPEDPPPGADPKSRSPRAVASDGGSSVYEDCKEGEEGGSQAGEGGDAETGEHENDSSESASDATGVSDPSQQPAVRQRFRCLMDMGMMSVVPESGDPDDLTEDQMLRGLPIDTEGEVLASRQISNENGEWLWYQVLVDGEIGWVPWGFPQDTDDDSEDSSGEENSEEEESEASSGEGVPLFQLFNADTGEAIEPGVPVLAATGASGAAGGALKASNINPVWLAYVGGRLYFRAKALGALKANELAVLRPLTLAIEEVIELPNLPIKGFGKAAEGADPEEEPEETLASTERVNYLEQSFGTSLTASSHAEGSGAPEVLLAGNSAAPEPVAPFRFAEDTNETQWLLLDLGEPRALSQVGATFALDNTGLPGSGPHWYIAKVTISVSTDQQAWTVVGSSSYQIVDADAVSAPSPAHFEYPGAVEAAPPEVRWVKYEFVLGIDFPPGVAGLCPELEVQGLLAVGSQKTHRKRAMPFPAMTTDSRYIMLVNCYTSPPDQDARESAREDPSCEPKLQVLVLDPEDGMRLVRTCELGWHLQERVLHRSALMTNGERMLILVPTGDSPVKRTKDTDTIRVRSYVTDLQTDEPWPARGTDKLFDFQLKAQHHIAPHGLVYDRRNNMVWGWDPLDLQVCRWRNKGLAPVFDAPRPKVPAGGQGPDALTLLKCASPTHRLEGLSALQGGEAGGAKKEAAYLMLLLERLSQVYGPPAEPMAEGKVADELEAASGGTEDGNFSRLLVRGQEYSPREKGVNIVVLDEQFIPSDVKSFNINENETASDRMADYIASIPEGRTVMVAMQEDGAQHLTPDGRKALQRLGADPHFATRLQSKLSYALIGRKGTTYGQTPAPEMLRERRKGPAIVRQRLPTRRVPLCVDATSKTINTLAQLVLDNSTILLGPDPSKTVLDQAILLSALNVLTVQVFQLLKGTSPTLIDLWFIGTKSALLQLLLKVIDRPPTCELGENLASAALGLFITAIDVFYPTCTERCGLLVEYLQQYVGGDLSALEGSVLELLLRRMSDPGELAALLQPHTDGTDGSLPVLPEGALVGAAGAGKRASSSELMASLLNIATVEGCKRLDLLGKKRKTFSSSSLVTQAKIGSAAVEMLGTLSNQLFSQAVQMVITGPGGDQQIPTPIAEASAGGAQAGAAILQQLFTSVSACCNKLIDRAIAASDSLGHTRSSKSPRFSSMADLNSPSGAKGLAAEVDQLVQDSPVGALLPALASITTLLVDAHGSKIQDQLGPMANELIPLMGRVAALLSKVPEESRIVSTSTKAVMQKKVVTVESKHNYESSTDTVDEIYMPGATKITIVFDPRSRTENEYDFVRLWKDPGKTMMWHTTPDKFTGRNGAENFPGFGGRDALVLEGDRVYVEFHSDGSNEDWGFAIYATGEFRKKPKTAKTHWLLNLDRHLASCGAALAGSLIQSKPWGGAEEDMHAVWLEDTLFAARETSEPGPEAEAENMLAELIDRVPGSQGAALCAAMRKAVMEDQGSVIPINRAVYATCAALIKHLGLAVDAAALVDGRAKAPSAALMKAWKAGQKMRQYFDVGDVRDAIASQVELEQHAALGATPSGTAARLSAHERRISTSSNHSLEGDLLPMSLPLMQRGPSVFQGAEEAVIREVSNSIVARAKFLLSLPSEASTTNKAEAAKRRWGLLAQMGFAKQNSIKADEPSIMDKWKAVVDEATATHKLKSILTYRRKMAEQRKKAVEASVGERILRFVQSHVNVDELIRLRKARDQRALLRAEGLELMHALVLKAGCPLSRAWLLFCYSSAIRATRRADRPHSHVHYHNCVEGSDPQALTQLSSKFALLLTSCLQILRSEANLVSEQDIEPGMLVVAALQACALDYDLGDHELLEASGLLEVLEPILETTPSASREGDPPGAVRSTAWSLFEVLLPRCVGLEGQKAEDGTEEPTGFSKLLLASLVGQLERVAANVVAHSQSLAPPQRSDAPPADGANLPPCTVLVPGGLRIGSDHLGQVARHRPLGLRHTVCMWLRRDAGPLDGKDAALKALREGKIKEGDSVCRGPNWASNDDDGGDGQLGIVQAVTGTQVTVAWQVAPLKPKTYRYGEDGPDGSKLYDVRIVDPAVGGCLYLKGGHANLTEKEQAEAWSMFGLDLLGNATLKYYAVQGEQNEFTLRGTTWVPANKWVHVAVVQARNRCRIYVNGEQDSEDVLPAHMLQLGAGPKNRQVVESSHPYLDNLDQYWDVEVEGATSYSITFDPQTKTERAYDYMKFLKDREDTNQVYGLEKYSGGKDGSERDWPGLDGRPPLIINAPKFVVYFHSDASNNDWGFKFTATAALRLAEGEENAENPAVEDLNHLPLYLGQPPAYVCHKRSAAAYLSGVAHYCDALTSEQIAALVALGAPPEAVALHEEAAVDVLSLVQRCARSTVGHELQSGASPLISPKVLGLLLSMLFQGSFKVQVAASRLCALLLSQAPLEMVEVQARSCGAHAGPLVESLLRSMGQAMDTWSGHADPSLASEPARPAGQEASTLAACHTELLRALAATREWADIIVRVMHQAATDALPAVLQELGKRGDPSAQSPSQSAAVSGKLHTLLAGLALLGGTFEGLRIGGPAQCLIGQGDSRSVERCTVLGEGWPQHSLAEARLKDPDCQMEAAKQWDKLVSFGDAVLVVLHSEPETVTAVARTRLSPLPDDLPPAFLSALAEREGMVGAVVAMLHQALEVDSSDHRPRHLPNVVREHKEQVLESAHPYPDNSDVYTTLEFPGAEEMTIVFDECCRTEMNNDYVRIYKDDTHTSVWGDNSYTGLTGTEDGANWAGAGGKPPLVIPAGKCIVFFHSDGSVNSWGYKLTAKALCVQTTQPPERPPLVQTSLLAYIKALSLKALTALLTNWPAFVGPSLALTQPLVQCALADPKTMGGKGGGVAMAPRKLIFQSTHPYNHNADEKELVEIKGARKLLISFDPQTRTENACDFITLFKDESYSEFWGEQKYTGGKDGGASNWPGMQGRPPLEIPVSRFFYHFVSDGSVNDWGWRMIVTPVMGEVDPTELPLPHLTSKIYFLNQMLYDCPRPQPAPEGLEKFRCEPTHANVRRPSAALQELASLTVDVHEDQDEGMLASGTTSPRRPTFPRQFVVNAKDAETVVLRTLPEVTAEAVVTLGIGEKVSVQGEQGDWLSVKWTRPIGEAAGAQPDVLWVHRRMGDLVFLVPEEEALSHLTVIEDTGDATAAAAPAEKQLKNMAFEVVDPPPDEEGGLLSQGAFDVLPAAEICGDLPRLESSLFHCTNTATVSYSQMALSSMLAGWPEDRNADFNMEAFGGVVPFLLLLQKTFDAQRKGNRDTDTQALSILKSKMLLVIRGEGREGEELVRAIINYSLRQIETAVKLKGGLRPTRAIVKTIETKHPYDDNMDQYWKVSIPGAKRIKVVFDERSSTEMTCDYVRLYKISEPARTEMWGAGMYTGRVAEPSTKLWAGVAGKPPVYVEDTQFEVFFHSDGSNTDWGFKLTAYGIVDEPCKEERQAYQKMKDAAGPPQTELACYLLEMIAKEKASVVQSVLYQRHTLAVLRRYLEKAAPDQQIWVVHLLTSMLQELGSRNLAAGGSMPEVRQIAAALRNMTIAKFKEEDTAEALDTKSPLLQGLVQACVVLDQCLKRFKRGGRPGALTQSPNWRSSSGDESPVPGLELESGTDSGGQPKDAGAAQLVWADPATGANGKWLEVTNGQRTLRMGGTGIQQNTSTVVAAAGFPDKSGTHRWDIKLVSYSGSAVLVGVAAEPWTPELSTQPLGTNNTIGWSSDCRLVAFGESTSLGAKCNVGDVITVELDMNRRRVTLYRNRAFVALAVGVRGSGAVIEVEPSAWPPGVLRPAVTLSCSGDAVDIMPTPAGFGSDFNGSATADLYGAGEGSAPGGVPWLETVKESLELLASFARGALPMNFLARQFLPQCRDKLCVTRESQHPYDDSPFEETITLAGATALEVKFTKQTGMGSQDNIIIRGAGPDPQERILVGLQGGTDSGTSSTTGGIAVGDRVVRGTSWDWGDQDGGAGCYGDVVEIKPWKGKAGAGVRVRWRDNQFVGLYRWDYEGCWDIIVVGEGNKSTKPVVVTGDTLTLRVRPGPPLLQRQLSFGQWNGALSLGTNGPSHVTVHPSASAPLDFNDDFTLEAWVRTAPRAPPVDSSHLKLQIIQGWFGRTEGGPYRLRAVEWTRSDGVTIRQGADEQTCASLQMVGVRIRPEDNIVGGQVVYYDQQAQAAADGPPLERGIRGLRFAMDDGGGYDLQADVGTADLLNPDGPFPVAAVEWEATSQLFWINLHLNADGRPVRLPGLGNTYHCGCDWPEAGRACAPENQCPHCAGTILQNTNNRAMLQPEYDYLGLSCDFTLPEGSVCGPAGLCVHCTQTQAILRAREDNSPPAVSVTDWAAAPVDTAAQVPAGPFPILWRGMDLGDTCATQILLEVVSQAGDQGADRLRLFMQNAEMDTGVSLLAGGVHPDRWTHVCVFASGPLVKLLIDGDEVAEGVFQGSRMSLADSDLKLGEGYSGVSYMRGHMYDFRFWSRALTTLDISNGRMQLPDRGSDGLLLNLPLGDGESEDRLKNRGLSQDTVAVATPSCKWDKAVEPPNAPSGSRWGWKCQISPLYPIDSLPKLPGFKKDFEAFTSVYKAGDMRHDMALVRYINAFALKKNVDANQLLRCAWDDLAPTEEDLVRQPLLKELWSMTADEPAEEGVEESKGGEDCITVISPTSGRKMSRLARIFSGEDHQPVACAPSAPAAKKRGLKPIAARFQLLQMLNRKLKDALPYIDLGQMDRPWSAAALVSKCRGLIFKAIKTPVWDAALKDTVNEGGQFELRLSRSKAAKHIQQGLTDTEGRWTMFAQAFRVMHPMHPRSLRTTNKLYNVMLMGERAQDAGGPYRETWSSYCQELQSSALPLLLRTPNGKHAAGMGRDKWLLNPGATSRGQLEMLTFMGKIMGHAIRSKEYLPLNLASLVWKALAGQDPGREDLEAVDMLLVKSMDAIRTIDEQGVSEEAFENVVMETFTAISLDDSTVELRPGGANQPVTWANRHEYADLVERHRLNESRKQAAAVRAGMAMVVPQKILSLFSWDEVEVMVCGKPEVDVDLLESVTEYSGCRKEDAHVALFWQALRDFTTEERSMFLRFTWGRERLPLTPDQFSQRFKLQNFTRSPPDSYLPISHTCFFSLELPAYSNLEVMKNKLRYAIYNCTAIDGDDTDTGMAAAALGWED